jgi:D-glycero-alpha-D-manno-heptose-7-phosphate kinase
MIITRTPFRISFFGGGTDFPEWFIKNDGAVLTSAIDKYCYISCRKLPPFFEYKYRIVWSRIELVNDKSDIFHPSVRETLKYLDDDNSYEISHNADLPARSGLGSSSAFTVGLLNALYAIRGQIVENTRLADEAIHIERNLNKEAVGYQDQIIASYGGFNKIIFNKNQSYTVKPIVIARSRLQDLEGNLMLFFTGFSRFSSDITEKHVQNINKNDLILEKMYELVDISIELLQGEKDISNFGHLMHETWSLKKTLSSAVSTTEIDDIYNKGIKNGAIGGKILGAGGGGFILFYVPKDQQDKVRKSLKDLIHVPFTFENSGSKVVLYQPGGLD